MYCVKKVTEDMYWVGGNDRRLTLFENIFPIPEGVSYNSYLLMDEKTILLDTVDSSVGSLFLENVKHVLNGRNLDYLVVNHMEPDHCATMELVVKEYKDVKIVCNNKTVNMIKQFFDFDIESRVIVIKENDTLCTGKHTFSFVMAPMVHWPETMVTYDTTDKILYSGDAFGTFGALNGNYFADEVDFENEWLEPARRYYTNIVGKYGKFVQALLKKAGTLDISMICPLHGPIWRENLGWFIDKYDKWSSYTPEENSVMIVYGSIYGHTENVANIVATKLGDSGIKNIKMYDASNTDPSIIVSETFRCSHIIFASSTYNGGIFAKMETVLHDLLAHSFQNRTVALIENGSWGITSGKKMRELLEKMKDVNILENVISIKSSVKENQVDDIDALVSAIVDSVKNL